MSITFPNDTKIIKQINNSSVYGFLGGSYNLDLTSNFGSMRGSRSLLVKTSTNTADSIGDFGSYKYGVCGIAQLNGTIYVLSGNTVWDGGTSPFDSYTRNVVSGVPVDVDPKLSDMETFNGAIYVASTNTVKKFDGATWTSVAGSLNADSPHLITTLGDRLYWVDDFYTIVSVNTAGTVSSTTGTIDLGVPGYVISFLEASNDTVWIGLTDYVGAGNGRTYVYRWDGETQNRPTAKYTINAKGVLSGCIKDGIPYIVDTNGRLLQFTGGGFTEIDRFPLDEEKVWYNAGRKFNNRAIHPKGMVYDSYHDEILINISSLTDNSTTNSPQFMELPAGIWSYTKNNGLSHKMSASFTTPSSDIYDYGQVRTFETGCLRIVYQEDPGVSDGGRLLWGANYYKNATYTESTGLNFGLFTNDTNDNKQKFSHIITQKLFGGISDIWNKVYVVYKKLLNSTDKIVVKYKTEDDVPLVDSVTFTDIDRFTTTTDISDYSAGDDVRILQGYGAGKTVTIESITDNAGTYTVIVNDDLPTAIIGITGVVQFSKWIKAGTGEITYSEGKQYKALTLTEKNNSPTVQFKICMQFTGKDELYKIKIINNEGIKE